jgi:hypothetical protein
VKIPAVNIVNFEFWSCLGEHELELSNTKDFKGILEKYSKEILQQIQKKISVPEKDENWTEGKASLGLLGIVCQFSSKQMTFELIDYIKSNIPFMQN